MIIDQVKNTIRRYGLFAKKDKVLIGVSGGPDSLTLLLILNKLKNEFGLSLHIAHFDHNLRKNSSKDADFVRNIAEDLNIPVTITKAKSKDILKSGSIEENARNSRLDFLFKVAKKIKARKIALGHNLDDQAETVLMRILRGTGLYGLGGISAKREIYGFSIVRPLIEVKRKDIESFLKKRRIKARIDETNFEDIYFRNKIRNKLLVLLKKYYNKNIKDVLASLAQSVSLDYDYLSFSAKKKMKVLNGNIQLRKFLRLHPALQRLVLRNAIAQIKGDTRRITFGHIKEIEDLILNRPLNSIVDLPKGVSVAKKRNSLQFYLKNR
ncbi:MAG: tRNA lysidine(34) synthetase TilS [Candidatus Omnitrophica bacterium]|nr:tRNA lysidine(34) synthetase TilS [Candidatus Omnitrophota bacterium]